tara:strand:+ start:373 stop:1560 length:1188 start_codon:yes stop_codon:yes gene_type:complete
MIFKKKINFLVGNINVSNKPLKPFGNDECNFLDEFSKKLAKHKLISIYPDLKALSFWCRKKNIQQLKNNINQDKFRVGLGLLFHITPSNVPTNFFYSLVFGLLSGNSNIVKVPSKNFKQIEIICSLIRDILKNKKIKDRISIVRYEDNPEFTKKISSLCDGRLIWGGSNTIKKIKNFETSDRSIDLTFTDRFSFSTLNSKKVITASDKNITLLALNFYNDTYLYDQNACTSPHLIVWLGNKKDSKIAKERFWESLLKLVKSRYKITNFAVTDKLHYIDKFIIKNDHIKKIKNYSNLINIIELNKIKNFSHLNRGRWGLFFEIDLKNLNLLSPNINKYYQTLSYYGLDKKFFEEYLNNNYIRGIDRIVPIGRSMDMSFYWDGYDLKNILTRVIEIV